MTQYRFVFLLLFAGITLGGAISCGDDSEEGAVRRTLTGIQTATEIQMATGTPMVPGAGLGLIAE